MGLLSKLGKAGINLFQSKGIRKIGGNSKVIKTTAQTIGSKIPAIAGGKSTRKIIAKASSKTLSESVKIGGNIVKKVAVGGALIGGVTLGGAKVFDYVQDVRSKTPEQRQAEDAFDLWEDINDAGGNGSGTIVKEDDPSGLADDGGNNFYKFYNDIKDGETAEAGKTGMSWGLILGGVAVAGGLYVANKKGMFKKGKK